MKSRIVLFASLLSVNIASAQTSGGNSAVGWFLGAFAVVVFLAVLSSLANNLVAVEASKHGASTKFNFWNILGGSVKVPEGADGVTVLTKGHDILLEGAAEEKWLNREVKTFALQPQEFIGMSPIPKVTVEIGDSVKAGTPIYFDKQRPDIMYVSPVSGEFIELNRGAKRSISQLVILADKEQTSVKHQIPKLDDRSAVIELMKKSGAWSLLRQRPFDTVPEAEVTPKNIFISTFDTAPLAPDNNLVVKGRGDDFQKGLEVLKSLTEGSVFLSLNAKETPAEEFTQAEGVVKKWFHGKHPAGSVGVQIHHIAHLALGDVVWCMDVQNVLTLGHLFNTGEWQQDRVIAVTGEPLQERGYIKTKAGARIADLVGEVQEEGNRFVSGDVLTGSNQGKQGFVHSCDDQITVLKEGNEYDMFGWLLPKLNPTASRTLPSKLFPSLKFTADTNTHGEGRAFVVTGQYESLLPMDIHVQPLMKAILANDYERMEGLGLLELSEEDIALCEFACTSKQPLQKILRDGLDAMRDQV